MQANAIYQERYGRDDGLDESVRKDV